MEAGYSAPLQLWTGVVSRGASAPYNYLKYSTFYKFVICALGTPHERRLLCLGTILAHAYTLTP